VHEFPVQRKPQAREAEQEFARALVAIDRALSSVIKS
jgi:hypothetical protein